MSSREGMGTGCDSSPIAAPFDGVGPIETGIPVPTTRFGPHSSAQLRVLELPVGGSFLLTHRPSTDTYGRSCMTDEASRLRSWAAARGIRLCIRKIDDNSHRIWRVD